MCYVFILPQLNPRMSPLPVSSFKLHLFRTDNRHPFLLSKITMFDITVLQFINSAENMPISVESILEMKLKFHEKREFVLHKYTENLQEAILKI